MHTLSHYKCARMIKICVVVIYEAIYGENLDFWLKFYHFRVQNASVYSALVQRRHLSGTEEAPLWLVLVKNRLKRKILQHNLNQKHVNMHINLTSLKLTQNRLNRIYFIKDTYDWDLYFLKKKESWKA